MASSAIVVLVPELEPLLGPVRATATADGERGMPPHVTLLYPFVEEREIGSVVTGAERALAVARPFEVTFAALRRWPETLYLAPEPEEPFVAMIEALVAAFPQHPPYGGPHDQIVPHATVAHGDAFRFDEIEATVAPALPIQVLVERAWVMSEDAEGWHRHTPLPLNRR